MTAQNIRDALRQEPIVIWPRGQDGRLINLGEAATLQSVYRDPCDHASSLLLERFGANLQAVYVRGSVSIGAAVPPYSDLDLVAVGRDLAADVPDLCLSVESAFAFLAGVDIALVEAAELTESAHFAKFRAMLAVQSKLLAGLDFRLSIPSPLPDRALALDHFANLPGNCRWLEDILSGAIPTPAYRGISRGIEFWARWAMRDVLRASQLTTMIETREFSSHLGTCAVLASQHFPAVQETIGNAFWIERQARPDPAAALVTLREFICSILPIWLKRIAQG